MTNFSISSTDSLAGEDLQKYLSFPKSVDHQLLVIGNGFDIACGLRSRFSQFFEGRVAKLEEAKELEGDQLLLFCRSNGLTSWDMILAERRTIPGGCMEANWCDIESAIARVVRDIVFDSDVEFEPNFDLITSSSISNYLEDPNGDAHIKRKWDDSNLYADWLVEEHDEASVRIGRYLKAKYSLDEWNRGLVLGALLMELHALETSFREYLSSALEEDNDYEEKAAELLEKLISYGLLRSSDKQNETTILDFNYTRPHVPHSVRSEVADFINVHGTLEGEIVFGIDGTDCMDDPALIEFTKTYRLLGLKSTQLHQPVAFKNNLLIGDGGRKTVAIKFYGHSLAEADYSYFQSIFDMVSLYDSKVRLYFFFSNHRGGVEEEMFMRITRLLNSYGETMENKDHGKNLMHKLLLEGRLAVVEI